MANINKRKSYTIKEKLAVIERVKSGVSKAQINRELGIPEGTVRGWMTEERRLRSFLDKLDKTPGLERKKSRLCKNEAVDDCLYMWFVQKRSLGFTVSGSILKQQANKFFQDLKLDGEFFASDGWLWRWQKRHCIGEITISHEADTAKQFVSDLKFTCESFCDEQLYNCDVSALFYTMLPMKSVDLKAGLKLNKDRVTLLFCLNKAGTHKLPPLVIGKNKAPQCFKSINRKHLPVEYVNSSKGWMTADFFLTWFHETFVSSVQRYLRQKRMEPKALLFLDNCPAHPPADCLVSKERKIRAIFLPKNDTVLIQPLNQGIIYNFKVNYRCDLLSSLLSSDSHISDFMKILSLKEVAYRIGLAWESISEKTIQNCWRKSGFLRSPDEENQTITYKEQNSEQIPIYCDIKAVRDILEEQELTRNVIEQWIDIDKEELVCQLLTDEEIVERVTKKEKRTDREKEDRENEPEQPVEVPTDQEAVQGLDTVIRWLEAQQETKQIEILEFKCL